MKKQNILALIVKPAMRVTESVGIGIVLVLTAAVIAMITPSVVSASSPCGGPTATRLVTGLEGAMGSTIGPDGALYVTEGAAGRISRVDPETGEKTAFASGLPPAIIGIGGAIDVAFIDNIAYVLVTLVNDHSVSVLHRDRSPVRAANLPWRLPGRRFAPQPRATGHTRRRDQRVDRFRQHCPDRAGGERQYGVHGRGRPRPPHARNRQGCVVRGEIAHRYGGSLRRSLPP